MARIQRQLKKQRAANHRSNQQLPIFASFPWLEQTTGLVSCGDSGSRVCRGKDKLITRCHNGRERCLQERLRSVKQQGIRYGGDLRQRGPGL